MTTATLSLRNINLKNVCIAGFFATLALLLVYVWQINYLTRGSFLISSYQNQINKLTDENKNLEVSFAENSFLGQTLQKVQALNFQKVTSVQYMQIPDGSVAMAKTR